MRPGQTSATDGIPSQPDSASMGRSHASAGPLPRLHSPMRPVRRRARRNEEQQRRPVLGLHDRRSVPRRRGRAISSRRCNHAETTSAATRSEGRVDRPHTSKCRRLPFAVYETSAVEPLTWSVRSCASTAKISEAVAGAARISAAAATCRRSQSRRRVARIGDRPVAIDVAEIPSLTRRDRPVAPGA